MANGLSDSRPGITAPDASGPRRTSWWAAERPNAQIWLIGIIAAILIAWALRATVWVTMPLAFAFFIALAVWPLDLWVQHRVPRRLRWLGHLAAMSVILVVLALFFGGIWFAARQVAAQFPRYAGEFQNWWNRLESAGPGGVAGQHSNAGGGNDAASGGEAAAANPGEAADRQAAGGEAGTGTGEGGPDSLLAQAAGAVTGAEPGGNAVDFITGYASTIVNSLGSTISMIVLVFFFVLLMLVEAPIWRAKVVSATPPGQERDWFDVVTAASQRFRVYLLTRALLGLATGALYGFWIWIWGVDFVLVWAILAFLLNFIPTLGSLIAGGLPVIFALVSKDAGTAIGVAAGLLVIEQIMGNYVDPKISGQQLSISALVVLVVLLLWGWIWGVAGTLIAVPMTVLLLIAFAHIPALRPIALMLSDAKNMNELDESTSAKAAK